MTRRSFTTGLVAGLAAKAAANPPNILWILGEDMGPQLGCYGYPQMRTPNLDRLASQGVRFTRAFTPAPICSASRSGFNTGMYQTSFDAQHHRSHREDGYRLPAGIRLISHRLKDAGYFTLNVRTGIPDLKGQGKTDYNFNGDVPFESDNWRDKPKDKPFFAQINLQEAHNGPAFPAARKQSYLVNPDKVDLPPYYADHPLIRDEFANYLDAVNLLDVRVGTILKQLDAEGLGSNTLVFFMGDNGRCLLRGKQWCYDAGLHVPMIVRWPGNLGGGVVREDPVSALDMTATSLWAAGALPKGLHGQVMFGPEAAKERDYVFGARDRCGEAMDRIRSMRARNYNYIHNFMPEQPYTQFSEYIKSFYPTLTVMQELHAVGKLKGLELLFMADRKPVEELYDVLADPHEVNNLAGSEAHRPILEAMRKRTDQWIAESKDCGMKPEKTA